MQKHIKLFDEADPKHFKIEYDQDGDVISNVRIAHGGSAIVIADMDTARDFRTAFGHLFMNEDMKQTREEAAALGLK